MRRITILSWVLLAAGAVACGGVEDEGLTDEAFDLTNTEAVSPQSAAPGLNEADAESSAVTPKIGAPGIWKQLSYESCYYSDGGVCVPGVVPLPACPPNPLGKPCGPIGEICVDFGVAGQGIYDCLAP